MYWVWMTSVMRMCYINVSDIRTVISHNWVYPCNRDTSKWNNSVTWNQYWTNNRILIIILLLLRLLRLICFGMCPGVPTPIHPLMSKMRLVIKNWWDYQRTIFIMGPIHTRDNVLRCSGTGRNLLLGKWEIYYTQKGTSTWEGVPVHPTEHLVPPDRTDCAIFCHYNHENILIAINFPHLDLSCPIIAIFMSVMIYLQGLTWI